MSLEKVRSRRGTRCVSQMSKTRREQAPALRVRRGAALLIVDLRGYSPLTRFAGALPKGEPWEGVFKADSRDVGRG